MSMLSVGGSSGMRTSIRYVIMVLAITVMVVGIAVPAFAGPEGTLISRINSSRSSNGLAPLETYWDLTDDARAHSAAMMDRGEIYHSTSLGSVTGVWHALGENVGVGVDLNALHDAFMSSSSHRSNILGDYNYIGVGVKTDEAGNSWVTVIFMRAAAGLNGETTTTTQPPATTTTTTPAPVPVPEPEPETTTTQPPATTTTTQPQSAAPVASTPNAVKASAQSAPDGASDGLVGQGGKRIIWD
jgi:hypothetical protein